MLKHRSEWLLAIAGLVILLLVGFQHWRYGYRSGHIAGHLSNDIVTKMSQDWKNGHADEAIEEGQRALKNDPKNINLLQSLSLFCLARAHMGPAQQSEEWIRKSASYANEAASNSSRQDLGAIAYIIQAGKGLELAGDLSATKCVYYKQAVVVLENQGPVVNEKDTVTSYGKTLPLGPVLKYKLKTLAEVRQKMTDAHCDQ